MNLSDTFGKPGAFNDLRSDLSGSAQTGRTNDYLMELREANARKYRDTISELYDNNEKDAVFRSSMKKGGALHQFNASRHLSPERDFSSPQQKGEIGSALVPGGIQLQRPPKPKNIVKGEEPRDPYAKHPVPDKAAGFRREIPKDFPKGQATPQYEREQFDGVQAVPIKDEFQQVNAKFGFNPKNMQVCKKHRETPIEFYCYTSNEFYCRLCAGKHVGHNDVPIAEIANEVQNNLFELKHIYLTKRTHVIDRLTNHQKKIEDFFKIYYETLDQVRKESLQQEYEIRGQLDHFETVMKKLLNKAKGLSMVEFFHEQYEIKDQVLKLKSMIDKFSTYIPAVQLKMPADPADIAQTKLNIIEDLKLRLQVNLVEMDNSFALDNFSYATVEMANDKIGEIYKMLGPFDYSQYEEVVDEESIVPPSGSSSEVGEDKRETQLYWEQRKSGAQYRGDINIDSKRPDGKGFKVYQGKALYEGYFKDGMCHGFGRGITAKGEVYQGGFNEDQMDGNGFFYWPDGRIYEGDWVNGKRHGKGKYFWPNGKVYEGDFKNDKCVGQGVLYYPDGKRFEGTWKEGEKHGKGYYVFPNGAMYQVIYSNGTKNGEGKLISGNVSVDQLKQSYKSLAKKALHGKEFLSKKGIGSPSDFNQTAFM